VRDTDDDTSRHAAALGVPVLQDPSAAAVAAAVQEIAPDAVVLSSYNRIIGTALLDLCPFVNVHYAPLPRGRGRATVNWAILNGDDEAWITIHHVVPELDAGGILFQTFVPITTASTVATLYAELDVIQRAHIAAATAAAIAGDPGRPQDATRATYYCARIPDDGEIDWNAPSLEIDRLVRALQYPFPAAFTWLGLDRVHVDDGGPVDNGVVFEGRVPGRVVGVDRVAGSVDVLTGDGTFRLRRVRVGDGKPVDAADVIKSVRATLGLRPADVVVELRRLWQTRTSGDD
jgi:methionyl-tRNA formyltransferase